MNVKYIINSTVITSKRTYSEIWPCKAQFFDFGNLTEEEYKYIKDELDEFVSFDFLDRAISLYQEIERARRENND